MNKNKIGTIFLAAVLALAGIGVSFSALTDIITIEGSVTTGTVDFDFTYSGTWVWKHIDSHGIAFSDNPGEHAEDDEYLLVAWVEARDGGTNEKDVVIEWYNIFPVVDFNATIIAHYTGTIPAFVDVTDLEWITGKDIFEDHLYFNYEMKKGNAVETPVQLHNCDKLYINVTINIPQEPGLKNQSGKFGFNINAVQWNDPCEPDDTPNIVRYPEVGTAYIGYEDRPTGSDFDYNDFGMNMEIEEIYVDGVLESIYMNFTSVVNRAGDVHDIHIFRALKGEYTYNITRSDEALGNETPEVTDLPGTGDFDIILFDTNRWPNEAGQIMGQWVEIEITINPDNDLNLLTDFVGGHPDRWDLDDIFALYDPWMNNTAHGTEIFIDSWQDAAEPLPDPYNFEVPYIIVVPVTDWVAPDEGVTITDDYPKFDDYYRDQDELYEDWYL